MKVIIQIPCFNEEETLPQTAPDLPRNIPGVDKVEWLIIDDGSSDRTIEVARELGFDHVVRHTSNQGLARAYMSGLRECLRLGADIIVNTDGDNQYMGEDILKLVEPIVAGQADIVIGSRPISDISHFSAVKKFLQKFGSFVVSGFSKARIPDATSGFRAISREAALQMNVFSEYTYTLETLIQAGQKNVALVNVPIRVNGKLRPSRLIKSIPQYINRSIVTMFRIFMVYRPLKFFTIISVLIALPGLALLMRFLWFFINGQGNGHVQSLIVGSMIFLMGFFVLIFALIADLLSVNRKLLEEIQFYQRHSHAREAGRSHSQEKSAGRSSKKAGSKKTPVRKSTRKK